MRTGNNEKRLGIITRTAKETRQYRMTMAILSVIAGSLAVLLAVIYAVAALYEDSGSFTVSLNKADMAECGLSLSETSDLRYKTSNLKAGIATEMTNISGAWIPENVDISEDGKTIDGEHNGKDYIAYTFYLTNAGKDAVSYEHALLISNVKNNLDRAIRVRLYVNGEPTTYAKKSPNEQLEEGTIPFSSDNEIMRAKVDNLAPGDKVRYTVVIWIEGPDPDCNDFVIGGEVKIDMDMKVLEQKTT